MIEELPSGNFKVTCDSKEDGKVKITALAPWAGSKRTLASTIGSVIGPHSAYFEPFCGSMSVLLGKRRASMETVNDLHGDLVNLARVIQDEALGPNLYKRLRRTLFCQELFTDVHKGFREEGLAFDVPNMVDLERAVRFAIYSWFGRNGTIGTNSGNNFCVRYTSNGGSPSTRWTGWVSSIPFFHKRLKGVIILREDGFKVFERMEDKATTVAYLDPPYIQKGFQYEYDFAADDHERLAKLARTFTKTRIVISYYDHPDLAKLYPGWTKLPVSITKAMNSQGKRGAKEKAVKAPEVLLINWLPKDFRIEDMKYTDNEGLFE